MVSTSGSTKLRLSFSSQLRGIIRIVVVVVVVVVVIIIIIRIRIIIRIIIIMSLTPVLPHKGASVAAFRQTMVRSKHIKFNNSYNERNSSPGP